MKIKRFEADDMRQALRQVRDELGADAIILSSRRNGERVELTAAADHEIPSEAGSAAAHRLASSPREITANARLASSLGSTSGDGARNSDAMGMELKTLRRMLETQVAQLAWNDLARRSPLAVEVLRDLARMGFGSDITARQIDRIPEHLDLDRARALVIARLADELTVSGDRWLAEGSVVALVGCTGVGKTATIAKLAARWTQRHGVERLALVSTDATRFGGHEQILRLGRMVGAPAYAVDDMTSLSSVLARLSDAQMILIDTAGMSQRDERWATQLSTLAAASERIEIALTLAANSQSGAIEETLARCAPIRPSSCILTKLDEATSLGAVLSSLIRTRLPTSYLAEGQRIPQDLRPARSLDLVATAVRLAEQHQSVDEDQLRREVGAVHVGS